MKQFSNRVCPRLFLLARTSSLFHTSAKAYVRKPSSIMSDPVPLFDSARTFRFTQSPLPAWKPGNGAKIPKEIEEEEEVVTMDASQLSLNANYKLLIGGVVSDLLCFFYFCLMIVKLATHSESIAISKAPRPIAFVSTSDHSTGKLNLAPFSFFNALGQDPPTVMISVARPGGNLKDTGKNDRVERVCGQHHQRVVC